MTKLSGMRGRRAWARLAACGLAAGAVLAVQGGPAGAAPTAARAGHPDTRTATAFAAPVAWGANDSGQLGDGTTDGRVVPVGVELKIGTPAVMSVRSGCADSIALLRTGQVLDWGFNRDGALGNGTRTSSLTAVKVRLPAGSKVTAVRAGCDFNLALTRAGKVLTWGVNPASVTPALAAAPSHARPVQVRFPAGTKVTAISAGFSFALAVTSAGRVYAWGRNDSGQLGNGRHGPGTATPVRVRLPAGTRVTAVTAGQEHALALTTRGTVLAWGDANSGALGNGQASGRRTVPVRTKMPGGIRVQGLFAGCLTGYALTTAGKVLAWGSNDSGQLGDGTTTSRTRPVPVKLPAGARATAISAGCLHALALTATGGVLAWGDNNAGQLGDGSTKSSALPVPVLMLSGAGAIGSGPSSDSSLAIIPTSAG
jgi:alpha-tubulin suppressor-like RCC1 family protein